VAKFAAGVVDTGSNFATNVVEQVERHLQGIPYLQLMTGLWNNTNRGLCN
jgi:hypothetical protein